MFSLTLKRPAGLPPRTPPGLFLPYGPSSPGSRLVVRAFA